MAILVLLLLAALGMFLWHVWVRIDVNGSSFQTLVNASQVFTAALAAADLLLAVLTIALGAGRSSAQRSADASAELDQLSRTLHKFWQQECAHLGLASPSPLKVHWALSVDDLAPKVETVIKEQGDPQSTRGTVEGLANWFHTKVRHHQLVIIGAPGAGKSSALALLMRDLSAQSFSWVPIMLSTREWEPATQSLDTLMTTTLRALKAPPTLATHERLLPIIDGLDEIGEHRYTAALRQIRTLSAQGRPFILTSRQVEYAAAYIHVADIPPRAALIRLEPITPGQVTSYLAPRIGLEKHWRPVTNELTTNPRGVAARVLSIPLMAWLARITMSPTKKTAGELGSPATPADLAKAANPAAAQAMLLEHYLDAAYDGHHQQPITRMATWLTTLNRISAITPASIPRSWVDGIAGLFAILYMTASLYAATEIGCVLAGDTGPSCDPPSIIWQLVASTIVVATLSWYGWVEHRDIPLPTKSLLPRDAVLPTALIVFAGSSQTRV